jgi:hypothetical protein
MTRKQKKNSTSIECTVAAIVLISSCHRYASALLLIASVQYISTVVPTLDLQGNTVSGQIVMLSNGKKQSQMFYNRSPQTM